MNNYLLFESEFYYVFLNEDDQYYLGRSVAVLKREARTLSDVLSDEWIDLGNIVKKYEIALRKTFQATNFNWSCTMNTAYSYVEPQPQVYWHVRPRYKNSFVFNERLVRDNLFGAHYQVKRRVRLNNEFLGLITKEIQKNL